VQIKAVPSHRPDSIDVRREAESGVRPDATFRIVLPLLPASMFPIVSQDDLERKLLGWVTRLEVGDRRDASAPEPPDGHRASLA
jgi:hypothetical protein